MERQRCGLVPTAPASAPLTFDSTQEIQILTTDYSPEFAVHSGGQIRVVSRPARRSFTGRRTNTTATTIFNANPWLRNANARTTHITAPIHYNQFGYNVNGPSTFPTILMRRSPKCFGMGTGMGSLRIYRHHTMSCSTLAMRTGDFSELLNPTNIFYGKAVQLTDPKTGLPFPK